jgi:AcrR family transcriptional regulator
VKFSDRGASSAVTQKYDGGAAQTARGLNQGGGVTATEQREARPRGTRLPRRARRNQLLGAAQEVFVAQGYHAAAMDDIADRAGVSKPVLYQHFPGKLDLYLALLDQHCEALLEAVRQALASTTDNKQRVAATMDAYFAYVEHEGGAFRLVFESDLTNEPAVRERVDKVSLDCAEAVSAVIAEDTKLPQEQSMLLAVGMCGMAQITARYWLSSGQNIPRDAAAKLISSLSWRGIAGFPLHQ